MTQGEAGQARAEFTCPALWVAISLLTVVAFTVAGGFSALLRFEIIGSGYLPRGAISLLLLMALVSVLLRLWRPQSKWLSSNKQLAIRNNLLFLFCLLLAMSAIPGQEFGNHFYLNLLGLIYYSAPGTQWAGLFLPHVNPELVPATSHHDPAVKFAFEGLPEGRGIPYADWLRPLLLWTPYLLLVYCLLLACAVLLSKQWEERERLLYPLTQVPLEICGGTALKNKLLWVGFVGGAALYGIKGLHAYFPAVPDLNLQKTTETLFASGPLTAFNYMDIHLYPEMVGIAYLLSREVAFSFWFFLLFRHVQQALRMYWGINTGHSEFFTYQTVGGYLVLATAILWAARHHLSRELHKLARISGISGFPFTPSLTLPLIGGGRGWESSFCPSPLTAVLACFIAILLWATWAGASFGWAAAMFFGLIIVSIVVARVVCEAGIFIYSSPFRLNQILFEMVGNKRLGGRNVVLMTAMSWVQIRSTATMVMPSLMQALKIGSVAGVNRRQLISGMLAAIALSILTCHFVYPYVIYHWGVGKLGWWPRGSAQGMANTLGANLTTPRPFLPENWRALGLGALVTALLVKMRLSFLWFPLHPLGFVAWLGWPTERYWLSIFIGWLARALVTKFSGYRGWYALRPIAYGLTLGGCFILTIWIVVHFLYPAPPVIIE